MVRNGTLALLFMTLGIVVSYPFCRSDHNMVTVQCLLIFRKSLPCFRNDYKIKKCCGIVGKVLECDRCAVQSVRLRPVCCLITGSGQVKTGRSRRNCAAHNTARRGSGVNKMITDIYRKRGKAENYGPIIRERRVAGSRHRDHP